MSHQHPFKVVIVGASVAGLSLANMLQSKGIDYVVLEAYPTVAPQVGASIGLLPHGNRILDQLGLYDRILELAPPVASFCFRDETGSELATYADMDKQFIKRHGYPMVFLDRQMLLKVLHDNLKDKSKVLTGKRVIQVDLNEKGVRAITEDESSIEGDILIGADGIHSTIREQIWKFADRSTKSDSYSHEREAPPCDYNCIFGISNPCPGISSGDLHGVFRNGASYLVTGGPGGRVYWFRFQKLPQRLYGSKIPRYTPTDLHQAIQKYSDDQILPHLRFSKLIENKVSAVMTPLPEYIFKSWHFNRIFLLGDSAHKFHPIGGHGGNAAIESAATLTNSLMETLNNCPSKALETSQIASIFENVQEKRWSRLMDIQHYSHSRQLTESLDTPLRKFLALRLLPLVDEQVVTLTFSAQFPGSEKLTGLQLPCQPKLVPYKDELISEPKPRGQLQWILIGFYLTCSAIATFDVGAHFNSPEANHRFGERFAHWSIPKNWTKLAQAWAIIPTLPQSSSKRHLELFHIDYLDALIQSIATITIEGYRVRHDMTPLGLPLFWLGASHFAGICVVMPLYYVIYTMMSNAESYWWPLRRHTPPGHAYVILAVCFVTYMAPSALALVPWTGINYRSDLQALSCLSPLLVPTMATFFRVLFSTSHHQNIGERAIEYARQDLTGLKYLYVAIGSWGVVLRLYRILKVLITTESNLILSLSYSSGWVGEVVEAFRQANLFSEIGFFGYYLASYIWCVQSLWDLKRVGRSRLSIPLTAIYVLGGYIFLGPGATYAAVWYVRENAMAQTVFNLDGKLHRD